MKGKVIIITGASSGIGKALALEYASDENMLVIAARNKEKLEEVAGLIMRKGIRVNSVRTDVSQENECRDLIQHAVDEFGRIDILINNAGISMRTLFEDCKLKVIKQLMDINFWGTVCCTKHALPYLLESHGSVVGISSIAGFKGLPGRTGYSASKFAMHGFLEALRTENLNRGLHVMIASPGFTSTNIRNTALGKDGTQQGESPRDEAKMMTPEIVAKKIRKAVANKKRTLILTTQGKMTVILNKFFPSLMDRMVYNHMAKEPDSPFK